MWQALRSLSDTFGVGFLAMQLVKLIGMFVALVGPLKFLSGLFAGIFPLIANFFKVNFGWTVNGLDVMAVSIAVSGTLIVVSSIATRGAMSTKYIWRFFLIPYAFIVITVAIAVQIATPVVELDQFGEVCASEGAESASFYGSSCMEMAPQLRMLGTDVTTAEPDAASPPDEVGIGFWLAIGYLMGLLPLIAVIIFFFKRLSINKLLKRVVVAVGSALGLVAASAAISAVLGS
ncbi:MAG: hypothetical protein AAFR82_04640 [Pseudomonadota bacterium]